MAMSHRALTHIPYARMKSSQSAIVLKRSVRITCRSHGDLHCCVLPSVLAGSGFPLTSVGAGAILPMGANIDATASQKIASAHTLSGIQRSSCALASIASPLTFLCIDEWNVKRRLICMIAPPRASSAAVHRLPVLIGLDSSPCSFACARISSSSSSSEGVVVSSSTSGAASGQLTTTSQAISLLLLTHVSAIRGALVVMAFASTVAGLVVMLVLVAERRCGCLDDSTSSTIAAHMKPRWMVM